MHVSIYDDFEELDVSGKVVLVLAMEPQLDDPDSAFLGTSETIHAYNFYKHEVLRRVPYSLVHLGRLERDGKFPRRVRLGAQRVGWLESEIEDWIAAKCAERDADEGEAA